LKGGGRLEVFCSGSRGAGMPSQPAFDAHETKINDNAAARKNMFLFMWVIILYFPLELNRRFCESIY
jgi:hypothetical protein